MALRLARLFRNSPEFWLNAADPWEAARSLKKDVARVPDASGTFNEVTRHASWLRLQQAGAQLMTWFAMACELLSNLVYED